ncbi:MAG TPA: ABC transporter ATP-binding protein [Acholeplasmatales bacterium]|nr:ABC transporter ATP-binding protein [Acholeplasmatales bacterium]
MKTAVTIRNLVKTFGDVCAVNHLNLDVPEGSIYGFLGPNGSGKTTTLKMLVGMTEPDSGEIELFGNKVVYGNDAFREDIGFLPDVPGFYDWMTAKEFLQFSGSLYHIDPSVLQPRIQELLTMVGLTKSANKRIGGFSRGMKQRLGIAQALVNDPKIILLDEPVSALDPIGRKEVMEIIGKLAGKVTVFFSTHILADVERICDRVIIIKDGKALLEDSIDNIHAMSGARNIEMEFENGGTVPFGAWLETKPWVESLAIENRRILLKVGDLQIARTEILQRVSEQGLLLKKFVIAEPTLEDIFIKAVNAHA